MKARDSQAVLSSDSHFSCQRGQQSLMQLKVGQAAEACLSFKVQEDEAGEFPVKWQTGLQCRIFFFETKQK